MHFVEKLIVKVLLVVCLAFVAGYAFAQDVDLSHLFDKDYHPKWRYVNNFGYHANETTDLTLQYKGGVEYDIRDDVTTSFTLTSQHQADAFDIGTNFKFEIKYLF